VVGRLGFAPSSRRLRAGTSLSKFATLMAVCKDRHEGGVEPPSRFRIGMRSWLAPGFRVVLKWSSIRVLRPVFRFGRPACLSLNTYAREKWNPVLELHQPLRICKPPPELIGQRDMKRRTEVITSARDDCVFCVLNPIYLRICLARIFSLF
jgi:hypothetical protein